MKSRLIGAGVIAGVVLVAGVLWVQHVRSVGSWLSVHTGTVDEPGPYYAFWSGFGSDLAEFAIIGTIATGVYHVFRRYNCHEPGCWRIGNHPAAGGQFNLCYRHHPDYMGHHPTHELIERLHREHLERQAAVLTKLNQVHDRVVSDAARPPTTGTSVPEHADQAVGSGPKAPS
jgi:hypothetical protein